MQIQLNLYTMPLSTATPALSNGVFQALDTAGTPTPALLAFYLTILNPKGQGYITSVSHDSMVGFLELEPVKPLTTLTTDDNKIQVSLAR